MKRTCLKTPFQGLSEYTIHTPTYLRPRKRCQSNNGFMRLRLWLDFWGVANICSVVTGGNLLDILYSNGTNDSTNDALRHPRGSLLTAGHLYEGAITQPAEEMTISESRSVNRSYSPSSLNRPPATVRETATQKAGPSCMAARATHRYRIRDTGVTISCILPQAGPRGRHPRGLRPERSCVRELPGRMRPTHRFINWVLGPLPPETISKLQPTARAHHAPPGH